MPGPKRKFPAIASATAKGAGRSPRRGVEPKRSWSHLLALCMTGPMRAGATLFVSILMTSSAAWAAGPQASTPGWLTAQARPRPVQKGQKPIQPGQDVSEVEAAAESAAPAPEPQDLEKIREEARSKLEAAAKNGDAPGAAQAVKTLLPFVKLEDQADAQVRAALVHIESNELARAEKLLEQARGTSTEAEMVGLAHQAVSGARERDEESALASITDVADPRPAAKVLAAGMSVDPEGRRAAGAADQLARKLDRKNLTMSNERVAQAVEALAILENAPGDTVARLTKAAEAVGAGRLADAEAMFRDIRVSAVGPEASQVSEQAVGWVRARRIRDLEVALDAAQKKGDVLEESRIVQALLDLDPKHREANRRARDIERRVLAARMKMVKEAREAQQLGVAHWYAKKGLEVDPNHAGLTQAKREIEETLKKRTDLIMVVESPTVEAKGCGAIGPVLQREAMEVASRREDLGGYVLSPGWTEAWKKGDARAPTVTGSLVLTVTACEVAPASGSATVQWSVRVPQNVEGAVVAEGEETVQIAGAAIPKEEQDAEANTARRVLSDRIATIVSERISESRDAVEAWLLTLAGYEMSQTQPVQAADAWARFNLNRPVLYDEELAAQVQTYLAQQYR